MNKGQPLYTEQNFRSTNWAGWDKTRTTRQCPFVSDAIYHNGQWHLFLYGYNSVGKISTGLVQTSSLIKKGLVRNASIITPEESFDKNGAFYPKVTRHKAGFLMAYDGLNQDSVENVCLAHSENLIRWDKFSHNPVIADHSGWHSKLSSSEPNTIISRNDSIFLLAAGTKAHKDSWWHRRITKRCWMDYPGNVDDAQLGIYLSTDGGQTGQTFLPHVNNPIIINDYADPFENEHMGGNIEFINHKDTNYIIYQAKARNDHLKYNLRVRKKPNRYGLFKSVQKRD